MSAVNSLSGTDCTTSCNILLLLAGEEKRGGGGWKTCRQIENQVVVSSPQHTIPTPPLSSPTTQTGTDTEPTYMNGGREAGKPLVGKRQTDRQTENGDVDVESLPGTGFSYTMTNHIVGLFSTDVCCIVLLYCIFVLYCCIVLPYCVFVLYSCITSLYCLHVLHFCITLLYCLPVIFCCFVSWW